MDNIIKTLVAAKNRSSLLSATVLSTFLALGSTSKAADYTLTDLGTVAHVDADSGAGMDSWKVSGAEQLVKQWFYYRVGGTGFAMPINTISSSTHLGGSANSLFLNYANAQVSLTITYVLTGGGAGAGSADIQETISVQNVSNNSLDFHFFQYSDFNLVGAAPDTVQFLGTDSVKQTEGLFGIQEGIISPPSSHLEAGYAGVGGTLDKILNTADYNLNDVSGPLTGDVTWAFQWDRSIGAGESLTILKDKTLIIPVIPEPSAMTLLGLGLVAVGSFRRRNVR